MKTKYLLTAGVLAMLASVSAKAGTATTYTNGDFFLDIRDVSASSSYLIDIGGGTTPFNFATNFSVPIAGLTNDLNNLIGTGWATNPNVYFSLVGGTVTTSRYTEQLYATNPTTSAWQTQHSEAGFAGDIGDVANDYVGNTNGEADNSQALVTPNSSSPYVNYATTGFDQFGNTIEGSVESSLNLDYVPSTNPATSATLEGAFTVDSANNSLDFTSATAAVPEPSTIGAFILGAASLLFARRRRLA